MLMLTRGSELTAEGLVWVPVELRIMQASCN